eukprot:365429-Chlamydomonas_euryale.AAC.6
MQGGAGLDHDQAVWLRPLRHGFARRVDPLRGRVCRVRNCENHLVLRLPARRNQANGVARLEKERSCVELATLGLARARC